MAARPPRDARRRWPRRRRRASPARSSSASIIGCGSAPRDLDANRLEQQIRGRRHDAAEHEHLRIGDDDEVGRGHAEILRRVAHDRDRHAVAVARRVEHVIDVMAVRSPSTRPARAIDRRL